MKGFKNVMCPLPLQGLHFQLANLAFQLASVCNCVCRPTLFMTGYEFHPAEAYDITLRNLNCAHRLLFITPSSSLSYSRPFNTDNN